MRVIKLLFIMLTISINGVAQKTESIIERNNNGIISSVKYPFQGENGMAPENAASFFAQVLNVRNGDSFKLQHSRNAKYGMSFERYAQFYQGIEVDGGYYSFRYKNGRMLAACGNYVPTEELSTTPSITEESAKSIFAKYMKEKTSDIGEGHIKLVIVEKPSNNEAVLAYKVYFETSSLSASEVGYIDAHTGDLIFSLPAFVCYSTLGTFSTYYNNDSTKTARTEYVGGTMGYILYDSTRGNGIHTYNGTSGTPYEICDADNIWTEIELGTYQMALDVHWTLQQIYDVLKYVYGHNSFDGANAAINAYISPGLNTYYNMLNNKLFFGQGDSAYNPMASVDIIGHEFGHAILNNTTHWQNFYYERGAMHEGFGDIWGILFEHQITPNAAIWKTGEDVIINYDCERDFASPNNPNAYTQIANTYNYGVYNTGDNHVKGGIASHWFYLLANGGSGINERGNAYTVFPVGLDLAEELFTYTVLNNSYLDNCSTFVQVREAFVDAANDMDNPYLAMQVANAWYAVGVGSMPSQINLLVQSSVCSIGHFFILNCPSNVTVNWNVDNSVLTIQSGQGTNHLKVQRVSDDWTNVNAQIMYGSEVVKQFYAFNIGVGCPSLRRVEIYNEDLGYVDFSYSGNKLLVDDYTDNVYDSYEMYLYKSSGNSWVQVGYYSQVSNNGIIPYFGTSGFYKIKVRGYSNCGYSDWLETYIESGSNRGERPYDFVYNSDSQNVTIRLLSEVPDYEVQLWNSLSLLKREKTSQSEYCISLQGMKNGVYIVRIIIDGITYTEKIIRN